MSGWIFLSTARQYKGDNMQKIEAIIRLEKLEDVKNALEKEGFIGITLTEVKGRGAQKGIMLEWRAGEYRVEFLSKLKLEIVVDDKDLTKVVDLITTAARTGKIGDGKLFVYNVEDVIRVRTGESGKKAV
jgi:nitrogen regulatory protein P-II 1